MPKRTPRRPSPFLRLPVEVIDIILAYAYAEDSPAESSWVPHALFCRHLQPSFTRFLYRNTTIRTLRALRVFCATIRRRRDLASRVRTLRIDFHGPYGSRPKWPEPYFLPLSFEDYDLIRAFDWRREGHEILLGHDLVQLWMDLSELRVLVVARLPLELDNLVRGGDAAGRQRMHFRCENDMPPLSQCGPQCMPNPRITSLSIVCDQSNGWSIPAFATLFPELREFSAVITAECDRLAPYVERLPTSLRKIDLRRSGRNLGPAEYDVPVWDDILPLLPNFPDLETLYLPYGAFDEGDFVSYLRFSRIRRIGFDWDCQLSDDTLLQIVEIPHIEHVTLSHLEPILAYYNGGFRIKCRPIERQGVLEADWAALQDRAQWNLCATQWPDGGTWEGLQAFFAKAKERNVVVDGTALAIKKGYEGWRQEQLAIVVEQGVQRGDWSTADESDFSWQEIRDYMARQWMKERKEHYITPPGPAPLPSSSSYSSLSP